MEEMMNEVMNNEQTSIVSDIVEETAIIAKDTKIVGNIKTKGHVAIEGFVEGDVTASGNVIVTGSVRGNIQADNIIIASGQLIANLYAKHQVAVKQEAVLNGDIECEDVSFAGTVNGDTNAKSNVALLASAKVTGNIKCAKFGAEVGTIFNGSISME